VFPGLLETSRSSKRFCSLLGKHTTNDTLQSASAHSSSFLSFSTLRILFTGMELYHSLPILRPTAILCPLFWRLSTHSRQVSNYQQQEKSNKNYLSNLLLHHNFRPSFCENWKLTTTKSSPQATRFLFQRSWSTLGCRSWSNLA
jgi:hypothetical protein